jgi:hypothetical protein
MVAGGVAGIAPSTQYLAPSTWSVRNRIFTDQVPGATLEGEGENERVVVPVSAYEAALRAGVFEALDPDNYPGRPRDARIKRLCANPGCGLTFLVIKSQASKRGPYCSTECARARDLDGVLHYSDAGAYIAKLRGEEKPLSRERVRQYVVQGRLPKEMTKADIDAAFEAGTPKVGVRGRLKAPEGFLTTSDVAERSGLSPSLISELCARGELSAVKERGCYLIAQAAFEEWRDGAGQAVPAAV